MKVLPPPANDAAFKQLLSFDFDGTLLDPEDETTIHPQFFDLIKELRQSHHAMWGLNTGRSLFHTLQGMEESKFSYRPDYIIAREREIYFPNQFGRWVDHPTWNKACEKDHKTLFRKNKRLLNKVSKWIKTETSAAWGSQADEPAGVVATTETEMQRIIDFIDSIIPAKSQLAYQRNSIYMRFSHSLYHKGSALAEVGRSFKIDKSNIFTIGDGHNDLDMLDTSIAEMIACPANAHNEVKNHVSSQGGYVAKEKASQGVTEALKNFIL